MCQLIFIKSKSPRYQHKRVIILPGKLIFLSTVICLSPPIICPGFEPAVKPVELQRFFKKTYRFIKLQVTIKLKPPVKSHFLISPLHVVAFFRNLLQRSKSIPIIFCIHVCHYQIIIGFI